MCNATVFYGRRSGARPASESHQPDDRNDENHESLRASNKFGSEKKSKKSFLFAGFVLSAMSIATCRTDSNGQCCECKRNVHNVGT